MKNSLFPLFALVFVTMLGCGGGGKAGPSGSSCATSCNGTCVDLKTSADNCGACGNACAAGQACVDGSCQSSPCSGAQIPCNGTCVDTSSDTANCGSCGNACASGETCVFGTCKKGCGTGQTQCGSSCVDTTSDAANCGSCGNACGAGEQCTAGKCASICTTGQTYCGSSCVDTTSDAANCGSCGNACGAGEQCTAGKCASICTTGQTYCGSSCVDTTSDAANCGSCGNACGAGMMCVAASCTLSPYGTGVDGALTTSADTTINTLASPVSGQSGQDTITPSAATGFAAGQLVFLHQTQGTGAGNWEVRRVLSINGVTVTLDAPLQHDYVTSGTDVAQVVVIPQYTQVTIDGGALTAPVWDGAKGGILALAATQSVTIAGGGSVVMSGQGFRGFPSVSGHQGESSIGPGGVSSVANGTGGGGSPTATCTVSGTYLQTGGGAGGGYATAGTAGATSICGYTSAGGGTEGSNDQALIYFGGGGGTMVGGSGMATKAGGRGGGIVYIAAPQISVIGKLASDGADGAPGVKQVIPGPITITVCQASSGAGAAGAIYLRSDSVTLSSTVTALGGSGSPAGGCAAGGNGGDGRITIRGVTAIPSVVGSSSPAFTAFQ